MENIIIIVTISILIIITPFVSSIAKISVAVVEILFGVFAAHIGLLQSNELFFIIAKVGFLYLMFLAGMEVDLRAFFAARNDLIKKSIIYFIMLYSLAFLVYLYFKLPEIYLVALPVMSIGMMMPLIREYGKNQKWLYIVFTIGVLGELISIFGLVLLDGYYKHGFDNDLFKALGTLMIFLILSVLFFRAMDIIFWWYPKLKLKIIPLDDKKFQDVRFSMAFFFVMIALMIYLKLEMVLGSFIAGIFISTFFDYKKDLPERLNAFGFGFLVPVFFIYVGSTLDLKLLLSPEIIKNALFIIIMMVIIKGISAFVAFYRELGLRDTILAALGDSMPLSFLVACATIGYSENAISKEEYNSFILAAMSSAVLIMIIIKLIHLIPKKDQKRVYQRQKVSHF